MYIQLSQLNYVNDEEILQVEWHLADWRQRYIHRWSHLSSTYINIVNISMQARCQLQWRPTFLPSNFYFLRARQGGRSHHATNYESGAKCSADIRVPLAPPSGSAVPRDYVVAAVARCHHRSGADGPGHYPCSRNTYGSLWSRPVLPHLAMQCIHCRLPSFL